MTKEEMMFQKRMIDLSNLAYKRDIAVFSDFLNLNELNILHTTPYPMFSSKYELFGGYEFSERQMVLFLPDAFCCDYKYPIEVIKVEPVNVKFSDQLNHRDYLGALMNMGLERSKFGDILVLEKEAYIFVKEEIAEFVQQNLSKVKHTSVKASIIEDLHVNYKPKCEDIKGTVASVRLDTVMSVAFPLSRSKLTAYITGAKVFVNGKLITSNGYKLKENDFISIRGVGRLKYCGTLSQTKKGRMYIQVKKYI